MRICLVYDCLYPYTIGGAERWYRALAERLAETGHEVSYVTLRQWPRSEQPQVPGVRVVAFGPQMNLYSRGRRRIMPPLVFGAAVLLHLFRFGGRYDVVHTASFPYFSVLAASGMRHLCRFRLYVDWFEVWTREYWRDYLGPTGGAIGAAVQSACVRTRHTAFCFSQLHARRLRDEGHRGEITVLRGLYAGDSDLGERPPADDLVVYAGRHIPEKRVTAVAPAVAAAHRRAPELRGEIFGDGPDREEVLRQIEELGLNGVVEAPGIVPAENVQSTLARALCLLAPSRREGYGLVVVEAAAVGTPSIVVAGPDNASTELVEQGKNGFVVQAAHPEALADAVIRVRDAGEALRNSTAAWFERNRRELSIDSSLKRVLAAYGD
jgi:glycosyltransferase involved in cell wall biosynthesis